jgi:hypothetical protein
MEGSGAGYVDLRDPDPGGPRYTDPDADPDLQLWFEVRQCMDIQNFFLPFKKPSWKKSAENMMYEYLVITRRYLSIAGF